MAHEESEPRSIYVWHRWSSWAALRGDACGDGRAPHKGLRSDNIFALLFLRALGDSAVMYLSL
jgi:hypothetical protein